MPIEFQLMRDGRVIYQHYTDPLDMRDVLAYQQKYQSEVLPKAKGLVHTITDTTGLRRLPSHVLSGGMSTLRHVHPMSGELIIVAEPGFMHSMAQVFQRMSKKLPVTVFPTLDKALAYVDDLLAKEKPPA